MVGKSGSHKNTHNHGCGLCHPEKRHGNGKDRFSARDRRAAEAARAAINAL